MPALNNFKLFSNFGFKPYKKTWLLILVSVCFFQLSCFQQNAVGHQLILSIPANASQKNSQALLYLPDSYKKNSRRYPLIIYLHGVGQAGTQIQTLLTDGLPKQIANGFKPQCEVNGRMYDFIVFSPQSPQWSYQSKNLLYMLPYLINNYRIDTNRIYVTGISAGGYGAYTCITGNKYVSKKIAAIVPVSALALDFSEDNQLKDDEQLKQIPVLSICGTADAMITNQRRYDTLLNEKDSIKNYELIEVKNGGHTVANVAYNPAFRFGKKNLNVYEWMLQYSTNNKTSQQKITSKTGSGKRIYVTKAADDGVYINGENFSYNAGDTIVLKASQNPFSYFALDFFNGTATNPVVVINEGGVAQLTTGFSFTGCHYIKVTGTGTADKYGFKISQAGLGVGISIQGRSSFAEVDHLEIYNKHYGIWVKQEADCADSLQFPNWVLHDISIHDNYIHYMLQEGMYLGSTDPNGTRTVTCNGNVISPKPLRLGNFNIYNNIIDSTWRGGIQLSDADSGINNIYNNTITNCGFEFNTDQGNGIVLGGYSHANIFNNYVRKTYTAGIFSLGAGLIKIYNNDVDSSGFLGDKEVKGMSNIMVDTRPTTNPSPGNLNPMLTKFIIENNVLGVNTDYNIRINKSFNTYQPGNILSHNDGDNKIAEGIDYK